MVLDCRNGAELVAVDPWLERSIVFRITMQLTFGPEMHRQVARYTSITEAFDCNMRLIRCPGSEV